MLTAREDYIKRMALRGHSFFVGCFSGEIEKGPGGGLFYLRSGVRFAVQGAGRTFCGIDLDVFAAGRVFCICIGGGGGALLQGWGIYLL